ncbi:MAG: hypothetical protein INH43_21120 [Acidobacteriaceae bacterium]|nr:hypothetical protein [Acidobacteriaceae bacterium]
MTSEQERDAALVARIEAAILQVVGRRVNFAATFGHMIREILDAVIDTPHSNRFTLKEIEKTEKTYIGTKVEIRLRQLLGIPKGNRLDLLIDGVEVDVKNTIHKQWSIPPEAIGHPCILIRINEKSARCSLGILVIREHLLNQGGNRDSKRGISREGYSQVRWILQDEPYPQNFWEQQDPVTQAAIKAPRGGTERLATLFRLVQRTPIPRSVVESVAQQKDSMKRLRRNGGARDSLSKDGIALLWGRNHRDVIRRLGLPPCGSDEFISLKPSPEEQRLLAADLES